MLSLCIKKLFYGDQLTNVSKEGRRLKITMAASVSRETLAKLYFQYNCLAFPQCRTRVKRNLFVSISGTVFLARVTAQNANGVGNNNDRDRIL